MNADTMPQIPKTFCPAKWQDININCNYNYVYSCLKAMPVKFDKDFKTILNQQKQNLLNGIQDPSCNYCWDVERAGRPSKRILELKNFDLATLDDYVNNTIPITKLELNIGNTCNFQCTYCSPLYSSKWEEDIAIGGYPMFTDRFVYTMPNKNKQLADANLELIKNFGFVEEVFVIGGEPLLNKNFWTVFENVQANQVGFATNLSCDTATLDRLLEWSKKYKKVNIKISLDATGSIAKFIRYGLDMSVFNRNLDYLLNNLRDNITVSVVSTLSSLSIRDLVNFTEYMIELNSQCPRVTWDLSIISQPQIQSFATLPDEHRKTALKQLDVLKKLNFVKNIEAVESSLLATKFSGVMYQELKAFLKEFCRRKQIEMPICLE